MQTCKYSPFIKKYSLKYSIRRNIRRSCARVNFTVRQYFQTSHSHQLHRTHCIYYSVCNFNLRSWLNNCDLCCTQPDVFGSLMPRLLFYNWPLFAKAHAQIQDTRTIGVVEQRMWTSAFIEQSMSSAPYLLPKPVEHRHTKAPRESWVPHQIANILWTVCTSAAAK